jgi:NADP-dependent 3-hydroxy acid dehydrogenase YdfG
MTQAPKRIWITGAGSGIGAAAAQALARDETELILSGRRRGPLDNLARTLPGTVHVQPLDVADRSAVTHAAQAIGPIDLLVASAGLNVPNRSLTDLDADGWDKVIDVNLNGIFYTVQSVLPQMRKTGGTIILISSWAGRYATRLTGAAYNASKRAVLALSETINDEEGAHGIRSPVILPGEVATDILKSRPHPPSQSEMARMLQPSDLGDTIRFVATLPARVCINEILISPTWNRFYQGFDEL